MKAFRNAVKLLSKPEQMDAVRSQITRMLEQSLQVDIPDTYRDEFAVLPELGSDESNQYINMSRKDICQSLGFPGETIVGLSEWRDALRAYGRWEDTPEAKEFWQNPPPDRLEETKLSWHQAVGVHFAASSMLRKEPFFLFDAVGVGKTAQSAGVIIMRPWLREWSLKHGQFPPAFGEFI